ncbi:MAG: hypothetical protein R3A10_12265 [Caldilineaceae bacterium]
MASDNPASEPALIDPRMVQIRTDPQLWPSTCARPGDRQPFAVHGLASNARTWDQVAVRWPRTATVPLQWTTGAMVLVDKPDGGYDFATVAEDLCLLMDELGVDAPILAGQSWAATALSSAPSILNGRRGWPLWTAALSTCRCGSTQRGAGRGGSAPAVAARHSRSDIAVKCRHFHPEWDEAGSGGCTGQL